MLSFCIKPSIAMNQSLYNYCKQSRENSIRKLSEKKDLERNRAAINNILNESTDVIEPTFNFYGFLSFLSITVISLLIYKRLQ
jgi:hypothetical protein